MAMVPANSQLEKKWILERTSNPHDFLPYLDISEKIKEIGQISLKHVTHIFATWYNVFYRHYNCHKTPLYFWLRSRVPKFSSSPYIWVHFSCSQYTWVHFSAYLIRLVVPTTKSLSIKLMCHMDFTLHPCLGKPKFRYQ